MKKLRRSPTKLLTQKTGDKKSPVFLYPDRIQRTVMAKNKLLNYLNKLNAVITTPNATRTTPVARFKVLGCALFANTAAILAHKRVKAMHRHRIRTSVPSADNKVRHRARKSGKRHNKNARSDGVF